MALGEFAGCLMQAQLVAVWALRRWAASRQEPGGALVLDGKAASEREEGPNPERC